MTRVTVLVPTHDHASTVDLAVRSALAQTHEDLEVLVVGDGAGDDTRAALAPLLRADPRVTFLDNPKGPRHGEVHRDVALREHATGDVVVYLADDDLAMPEHVATMLGMLRGPDDADFAAALPIVGDVDGGFSVMATDLGQDFWRRTQARAMRWNRVPLSCGGHTMAAYRRLPQGWATTPDGVYTDWHMWQKFLADDDVRARTATRPTVVHLPTGHGRDDLRRDWTPAARREELQAWWHRVVDPAARAALDRAVVDWLVRDRAEAWAQVANRRHALEQARQELAARQSREDDGPGRSTGSSRTAR